jgi:hypothetical protein
VVFVVRVELSAVLLLRLLLSVFVVLVLLFELSAVLLLRLLLSVLVFAVFVLRLLLSVFVVLFVFVFVFVVFVRVVVCVAVLPPRATIESSACAESEKASVMAVTSKVLFMRVPLWVWLEVGRL